MTELLRLLLEAGLTMTSPRRRRSIRDRFVDQLEDVTDYAARGYDTAVDRVDRLYRTVRGKEDHSLHYAASFVLGAGIGVGAALLLAPRSGSETRSNIAGKIHEFQREVRERVQGSGTAEKAETA